MTPKTNARIAGVTLLLYIAIGVIQMIVTRPAGRGADAAERLANMALYASNVRIGVLLGFLTCFVALALGVALYALTREVDRDLAMLGLLCRVAEGVLGAVFIPMTLGLLAVVKTTGNPPDLQTLGTFLFAARRLNPLVCATFFAVGSTFFAWLLLRGRIVPVALSWIGVVASVLLVIALPLQLAGLLDGTIAQAVWIPMAVFEVVLALWLLIKGVASLERR